MTAVVFARPVAVTPPPLVRPFERPEYQMLWTGVDGITWDLSSWLSGVYLAPDLLGIGHPPTERHTQDSPAVPGSFFGGARPLARPVQLPVVITTRTSPDSSWRELCLRWWKGWSITQPGTWTVRDSTGHAKTLRLLHNPSGNFSLNIDPGLTEWQPWMVDAVADQPYWEGEPVERRFDPPHEVLFFGGGDPHDPAAVQLAPPFGITESTNRGNASIPNEGTIAVPWSATLVGPFTSWSITIDGGVVSGPAIAAGDRWDISTDAVYPTVLRNGDEEITRLLHSWDPRLVPPGAEVPIQIEAVGAGTVICRLTPRYELGF